MRNTMTTDTRLPTDTPAIRADELVKTFRRPGAHDRLTAVDHVSFSIPAGQLVAFLGPNGAGKSTSIDMILGLIRPDSGLVQVLGGDPGRAARGGRLAAVHQIGGLLPDFTVAETMRAIAAIHGVGNRADGLIERWGLESCASTKVRKCSGGQQQRLRFALAMLPDPLVLILDEPTAGLDVDARRRFWRIMRSESERGVTILFATHYIEEADSFADRVILLAEGRVVADGPIAAVRAVTSGSTVSAVLPDAASAGPALAGLPGVHDVTVNGDRVTIETDRSDAVARHLLTATDAHDVLIDTTTLEDAFLRLTGGDSASIVRPGTGQAAYGRRDAGHTDSKEMAA
ncbi:ABC transporter ATP-binding protein [Acidipropionibacterium virtanenii]|uniref:Putative ABC transporter ATP-binding protein YbhF n=1 Tax=Acidipropionibacterium virtanenii TaxID=2057246 RepID=A0A344UWF6_9ACTN|nr:ABC transporter ATP-binding protein [Acidipropionibacterium virtanenii]AXE39604.1 putative ABC transporter ATP-binding protein YbhF [Acidipropionibacterium virtanenii]